MLGTYGRKGTLLTHEQAVFSFYIVFVILHGFMKDESASYHPISLIAQHDLVRVLNVDILHTD